MICFIALIVFGFLAIFSASYRPLAKEAFDCVFRRVTFRKCQGNLDARLKGRITGSLMRKSQPLARFVFRHFEAISWVFTILLIASMAYSGYAAYNYILYGNCNGKQNGESFCIFDPAGEGKFSSETSNYTGPVIMPSLGDDPIIGPRDAKVQIIEFGCYRCPYTKKAEPIIKEILGEYGNKVVYTFRDFPLSEKHPYAELHSLAARCALEQGRYWEFRDYLFERQDNMTHDANGMKALAADFGLNTTQFDECFDSERYMKDVVADLEAVIKAGVYGTPTFFINNRTIVGPQDVDKFRKIIGQELKK
jgi:protein-disulfide isomerase